MLTYSSLLFLQVKTSQAGRLRVNMGNIYYDQGKYDEAIVLYNMALDMLPAATKEIDLQTTGCLALSALLDEGIVAGCEGDLPAALTMSWMQAVTGQASFMANPQDLD